MCYEIGTTYAEFTMLDAVAAADPVEFVMLDPNVEVGLAMGETEAAGLSKREAELPADVAADEAAMGADLVVVGLLVIDERVRVEAALDAEALRQAELDDVWIWNMPVTALLPAESWMENRKDWPAGSLTVHCTGLLVAAEAISSTRFCELSRRRTSKGPVPPVHVTW